MIKENLKEKLTFLIAAKVDHEDRVRNIRSTLSYLRYHFDADIIISEQDTSSKLHDMCKAFKCRHIYIETDEFFDREHYWKCGGANEAFKGVGYEDNEINHRFKILDTKIMRTQWPLYHMTHYRGDTSYNHNPHINFNRDYCVEISKMNKLELQEHINTWNWHK